MNLNLSVCKELWMHWGGDNWQLCADIAFTTEGKRDYRTEDEKTSSCVVILCSPKKGGKITTLRAKELTVLWWPCVHQRKEERKPHWGWENCQLCCDLAFTKEGSKDLNTEDGRTVSGLVTLCLPKKRGKVTTLRTEELAVVWWPCVHQRKEER